MNAPVKIPLDSAPLESPTPNDLTITVRDLRFGRGSKPGRWWLNGDPVATAWYNSLSAVFPRWRGIAGTAARAGGLPLRLHHRRRCLL